jgi:hypothetical protein
MSGIDPKQNSFNFKIAPHKRQKSILKKKIGRKMDPSVNGALCLRTPKHNGKSGTVNMDSTMYNANLQL